MDNLHRDVQRLEHITDSMIGLERFSVMMRLGDFVKYYFSRFLSNAQHIFKDFSHSEITAYNRRYKGQIAITLKDPLLITDQLIVTIPKGMLGTYLHTLESLIALLEHIAPHALMDDTETIVQALKNNDPDAIHSVSYGKKNHTQDLQAIGQLYSSSGLTHVTFPHAFTSLDEVKRTNELLLELTERYYPDAIALVKAVGKIEHAHSEAEVEPKMAEGIMALMMGAAYRITIFALILEHIQDMEHGFVKSLEVIRQASARTKT